jgi:hypothetical protein
MELFTGLEANSFARCYGDLSASSRIAADAGLPRFHGEDAEPAQFDAVSGDQVLFHAFEDSVYRSLCFSSWQTGTLNNPLYQILLNHFWAAVLGL